LSGKVSLGVRGEKRLNTTGLNKSFIKPVIFTVFKISVATSPPSPHDNKGLKSL